MTASAATVKFIDQLRQHGVELWVEDGNRLRYSAPKGVINDDVLNELKNCKDEILALLKAEKAAAVGKDITPISRDGLLPLSFAQQRIWFLEELEPDNPFYNVALAKHISGTVDIDRLRESLLYLIRRHEVLRATCTATNDGPRLSISEASAIDPDGDWFVVEQLPGNTSAEELEHIVNAEVSPALPLNSVPLLRCRLFQCSEQDAVLSFTTHHFVVDGWSCGVLMRELSQIYAALSAGNQPELVNLPVQYPDFAAWQNAWLEGPELATQLDYWKAQLADLSTLDLPTDKTRPSVQTYRGDIHHFSLPADTGQKLKEISRNEGLTLYMTLLAAFQVLLHRYSQQDEVVLGTAVSNRHSAELEALLGPFVNTLVLRGDLSGNPTFRELIHRARDMAVGAFAHQDLPFELLVEHLKPERDRSRSPLFQVLFVVHQYSGAEELALTGAQTVDYPVAPGTTMYDLFLQLIELDNTFNGSIEYSTDLFERSTIERMTIHFSNLLRAIADNPDMHILDLPLMDDVESNTVLIDWNQTSMSYDDNLQLQQVVERQTEQTPAAIAVMHGEEAITYKELNERANRIAHHLRSQNISSGALVGIYLERSLNMMTALLAILKAGATYVPLDPLFPPDRIRFMMEDAELSGLLTQAALLGELETTPDFVLRLDADAAVFADLPVTNPDCTGTADDLAYVIYTSGSTGLPKGVQLGHRGVVNFLSTMAKEPGITAEDKLLAVTTLSFDIAVLELFMPLCNGAQLIIADKDVAADGARLAELIAQSGTSIMQATPATWQLLLGADWPGKPGLKILCGGEPLPRELADRLLATGAELWNMYGPTETTIWSSVSQVATQGPVTIGKPIGNTLMYIVDEQLRSVPIGVPGELCIGGDGVAKGYFKRPGLTAERFVHNPFSNDGSLMYKTGDLARYRADGEIECLGRNDNQVKVRGYRIELGEIETVMARHPAVTQAVVAAREDREGDKRLVGYLIANETAISSTELEQWENDQLDQWRDLWQNAYEEEGILDPAFNISGWNSSYSGEPIPAAEMREWVEATASRINALKPRRVLEIGSGTGLLVARVAPHCDRYVATDFSPAAISNIAALKASRTDLESVEAIETNADSLAQLSDQLFDVVVINSVAQYFPNQAYLLDVLKTISKSLSAGGYLFLGDLRALPLLDKYHTSVQLFQAAPDMEIPALSELIEQRIEQEEELLIDPEFFNMLGDILPNISGVEFQLKRGEARNEMTCFRYDAVVQLGGSQLSTTTPERIEWHNLSTDISTLDDLHNKLKELPNYGLIVSAIPDARTRPEIIAAAEIAANNLDTVTELHALIENNQGGVVEPESLYRLAEELQLGIQMISTAPGFINALFTPAGATPDGRLMLPAHGWTLEQCSNNPMQGRIQRSLVPALKEYLRVSLPEYMVPPVFSILDEFPLTPNGKIDRKALPAPDHGATQSYTPPRNETETALVNIWEDLLGLDQIGVLDDFFALGGHSLLATQLISRIRDQLQITLPLNSLFDAPTVAGLAEAVETMRWALSGDDAGDNDADLEEIEI